MAENLEIFKYKAAEKTTQAIKAVAAKYPRLNRDFALTKQDCVEGKNLSDNISAEDTKFELKTYGDFNVYVLGEDKSNEVIVYLHGGGYLFGLYKNQVAIMDMIAAKTGKQVYVVDYGLPLKYAWTHAYDLLNKVYDDICAQNKDFIMMGDSAGAGMGLGFVELLKEQGKKLPTKQILISPWLDLTMSNPESKHIEEDDAFLSIDCLLGAGELWAKDLDKKDYRVSPLFGDLEGLPQTMLTTGTLEVMYPDIIKLSEELSNKGTKVKLIVCEGLYHAYPWFPVEESKTTLDQILDFIS